MIDCNNCPSRVCNVCGHIWPRRAAYLYDLPLRCALCRTRTWNDPLPQDHGYELYGA